MLLLYWSLFATCATSSSSLPYHVVVTSNCLLVLMNLWIRGFLWPPTRLSELSPWSKRTAFNPKAKSLPKQPQQISLSQGTFQLKRSEVITGEGKERGEKWIYNQGSVNILSHIYCFSLVASAGHRGIGTEEQCRAAAAQLNQALRRKLLFQKEANSIIKPPQRAVKRGDTASGLESSSVKSQKSFLRSITTCLSLHILFARKKETSTQRFSLNPCPTAGSEGTSTVSCPPAKAPRWKMSQAGFSSLQLTALKFNWRS